MFHERKKLLEIVGACLSILVMAWIARFIAFPYIFATEQTNFSDRLVALSFYPLLPVLIIGAAHIWKLLNNQKWYIHGCTIMLLAITIGVQIFFSYPRANDNYSVSHAYSTGLEDIEAVRWIDTDANGKKYIVLANQAVSAAALNEFGFKQYYHPDPNDPNLIRMIRNRFNSSESELHQPIFYYPIPTGGVLYKYFLEMIYHEPTNKLALEAMNIAGVDRAYFVVNKYWYGSNRAVERARTEAALEYPINNSVWVFRYDR